MTESTLIQSIYTSFNDVTLEDGIGLYEADCIDEHMNPNDPVYIQWKLKDERVDWKKLLPLFFCTVSPERVHSSNFFFMDGKGKRFHLPCYLLQDLDARYSGNNPLITSITFKPEDLSAFDMLNMIQKQTVLNFLTHKVETFLEEGNDYDFESYKHAREIFAKYVFAYAKN